MTTWQKVRGLSLAEAFILVEAVVLLTSAWVGLRLLPNRGIPRLSGDGRPRATGVPAPSGTPARVSWAVRAMARRLPGKMTCLVQALAAHRMLRRRGFQSDLRIGVAGRESDGDITAHAWVEHDGQVVVGELEDLGRYAVLTSPAKFSRVDTALR